MKTIEIDQAARWMSQRMRTGELRHQVYQDAKALFGYRVSRTDLIDAYGTAERDVDGTEITVRIPANVLAEILAKAECYASA